MRVKCGLNEETVYSKQIIHSILRSTDCSLGWIAAGDQYKADHDGKDGRTEGS